MSGFWSLPRTDSGAGAAIARAAPSIRLAARAALPDSPVQYELRMLWWQHAYPHECVDRSYHDPNTDVWLFVMTSSSYFDFVTTFSCTATEHGQWSTLVRTTYSTKPLRQQPH